MTIDLTTLEIASAMLCASASAASNLDATIYIGRSNERKGDYPHVVCIAESADRIHQDVNLYNVGLIVQVEEKADDTTNISGSLAKALNDAFEPDNNSQSNLAMYSSGSLMVASVRPTNFTQPLNTDDKTLIKEMRVNVVCAQIQ